MHYAVFVRGNYHHVQDWESLTFARIKGMQDKGWVMIWDSAPSVFDGAKYAAQTYGAPVPYEVPILDRELAS